MSSEITGLETLQDIRKMMERSSRFISLSGWSGVAAGSCALLGAWFGWNRITQYYNFEYGNSSACLDCLRNDLLIIAAVVFLGALVSALFFTYLRSRREGVAIWGLAVRRLLWNTLMPMAAGGLFILKLVTLHQYELVASASLVFYGLALVNGSRFTIGEIRWLGYAEILTGLVCLWIPRAGFFCWAIGFGVLHILYGLAMWWKYERPGTR